MHNLLGSPKVQKAREYISNNKTKSIFALVVCLIIGYYTYAHFTNPGAQTMYVLGTAQTDTIVASITESGQVEANHQLDIKPQASANVVYVAKNAGDYVNTGDLIVELDTTDAEKAVRDAQANLDSANLSLQKIQEPADQLSLLQAQNSLAQANTNLAKSYDDGFNTVSGTFVDLPNIIAGLDGILHNTDVNTSTNGQRNIDFYGNTAAQLETAINSGKGAQYKSDAESAFITAKAAYDQNFTDYKNTSRSATTTQINSLVNETYSTSVSVADAVKAASNLIQYYQDLTTALQRTPLAKSTAQLNTLSGYINTIDGDVSTLANSKLTIANNLIAVPEQTASLQKLQAGADALDIQSAELTVKQRENALQDAKDNLANYYVRAPFSGTLSAVDLKVGDPASPATTAATLIANDEIGSITINEVDAAKIKIGDKATITFDAIDGLTLTGKVASIDPLGTVSSGVVNYSATISFDSSDARVKPGMSLSASIITGTALDVLTVPTSAIKTSNTGSYVLMFTTPSTETPVNGAVPSTVLPIQQPVETGLADDTNTEIISGLTDGQQIITRVIAPSTTAVSSAPSLLGAASGGNRGGGAGTLRGATRGN